MRNMHVSPGRSQLITQPDAKCFLPQGRAEGTTDGQRSRKDTADNFFKDSRFQICLEGLLSSVQDVSNVQMCKDGLCRFLVEELLDMDDQEYSFTVSEQNKDIFHPVIKIVAHA